MNFQHYMSQVVLEMHTAQPTKTMILRWLSHQQLLLLLLHLLYPAHMITLIMI